MKNWLWVITAAVCACSISSSCSEEEEGSDSYVLGVDTFASSSTSPDAIIVEIARVTDAFVAEFGAETFSLSGDTKQNDKSVVERFNKVAATYVISPDFTGYIVYCVSRGGNTLASHRFVNYTYVYDLAWGEVSLTGVTQEELSSIEQTFRTRLNSNGNGEYTISGADETACDAQVKKLFAEIGSSITLSAEWAGYAVFTSERYTNDDKSIQAASYRFEK